MRLVAILVLGYVCATQDRDARLHMTSNSDRKTTKNLKSSTGSSDEVTEEDLSMLQKEGAEALNNGDIATAELKMKLVKKLLPYLQGINTMYCRRSAHSLSFLPSFFCSFQLHPQPDQFTLLATCTVEVLFSLSLHLLTRHGDRILVESRDCL